ncbi:MAG TPA: acetyl-CoA carboxylase biotin carboxyl carrier protein [Clostridia bacterium]|nr:acetyl-CoA carboxylase biotin carboxyl carrier protein [Clostridia bacterium]
MEYEKIKKLMDDMCESNLTTLEIELADNTKIKMKKEEKQVIVSAPEKFDVVRDVVTNNKEEIKSDCVKEEQGLSITSPMVGTFYSKPSPDSEPYVKVGTKVKKGDIVCIIEAMKLMNEIEAECDGEISKVLVNDGEPVEYGKPLFVIV